MDTDFNRVAKAIGYLTDHVSEQPSLETVAARTGLSPFHFQRTFRRYAGVSPKQFLAALTLESSKQLLDRDASVLDAALDLGLSSPARLHDHFVTIEAMSPGEYKHGGDGVTIRYGFAQTPFGTMVAGATDRGLCTLEFLDDPEAFDVRDGPWPRARFLRDDSIAESLAPQLFGDDVREPIRVHVRGTNFQLRVWNALLGIAPGTVRSYAQLAHAIGEPSAARAVGNALAANPVGVLIPCHRVIASTGTIGNYRWGTSRKRALIAWEAARDAEASA